VINGNREYKRLERALQYDGHTYHHVLETGGQLDRELNHISSGIHHHSLL